MRKTREEEKGNGKRKDVGLIDGYTRSWSSFPGPFDPSTTLHRRHGVVLDTN